MLVGVNTTSESHTVVGGIFLSADQLLGVEQLTVRSGADLVDGLLQLATDPVVVLSRSITHRGVQVDEDGARHVFAAAGLGEESLERAALADLVGVFGVNAAIGLEAMLEQVPAMVGHLPRKGRSGAELQLPGAVTQLSTGLADVKVADLLI